MSIIRTIRKTDFTVIPNGIINDSDLPGDALGLLVYLLSKPGDWWIKIDAIATIGRFGGTSKVNRTLTLLRRLGYASMTRYATGHTEWVIRDDRSTPQAEPHVQNPHVQNPDEGFEHVLLNKDSDKEQSQTKNRKGGDREKPAHKSVKEIPASHPDIPQQSWDDWLAYRKERKLSCTPLTMTKQIEALIGWKARGHSPAEIINASIQNGWQGLFEPKRKAGRSGSKDESISAMTAELLAGAV